MAQTGDGGRLTDSWQRDRRRLASGHPCSAPPTAATGEKWGKRQKFKSIIRRKIMREKSTQKKQNYCKNKKTWCTDLNKLLYEVNL